ncbi:hypothetical protein Tco_0670758 [Tanacetum coccineum]
MCDVPLCENTTPLNTLNEHYEIVVNTNDDNSSSDDDSTYVRIMIMSMPSFRCWIVCVEVVEMFIRTEVVRSISLRDNPYSSSEVVTKSTSTFPNLFLEETNIFDNSIPESETFRFNLEEISSGSPTTHSELSSDYKLSTLIPIILKSGVVAVPLPHV